MLAVIAIGASGYDDWRADREHGRRMEQERGDEQAALAAIKTASPDPLARLRARGVELTYTLRRDGGGLLLEYQLNTRQPLDQAAPLSGVRDTGPRLVDPATGKAVGQHRQGGFSMQSGHPTAGDARFEAVGEVPDQLQAQFPYLLVYMEPEQSQRWEFRRPGDTGDVNIGRRFTSAGVAFEVERVRFAGETVQIDYRQLTDPANVGVHLLTFRLSDRMGGDWGGDYPLRRLPNPDHPSERYDLVATLSQHWSLRVEDVVLAVPGPTMPVEVK